MSEFNEYEQIIHAYNDLEIVEISPNKASNKSKETVNGLYLNFIEESIDLNNLITLPLHINIKNQIDQLDNQDYKAILLDDKFIPANLREPGSLFFTYIKNGINFTIDGKNIKTFRVIWINDNNDNKLNPANFIPAVEDPGEAPPVPSVDGDRAIYPFSAVVTVPIIITIVGTKSYIKNGEVEQASSYSYTFTEKFKTKRTYAFIRQRVDLDKTTVTGLFSDGNKQYTYTNGLAYAADKKWVDNAIAKAQGEKSGGIPKVIPLAKPPQHLDMGNVLLDEINFNDFVGIVYNDEEITDSAQKFCDDNLQKKIQSIIDSFLVYGPFKGYNETKEAKTSEHKVNPFKTGENPTITDTINKDASKLDSNNRAIKGHCISPNNCEYYKYTINPIENISTATGSPVIEILEIGKAKDSVSRIKFIYEYENDDDLIDATKTYLLEKTDWEKFIDNEELLNEIANILGSQDLTNVEKRNIIKFYSDNDPILARIFYSDKTWDFDLSNLQKYLDFNVSKDNSWEWEENL